MTFPDDPLGVMVELYLGGAWVDITRDVYAGTPITITRGRQDEAARVDAGTCALVLKNGSGRYSPRNPRSDLFGLLGRNTLLRVSVKPGAVRLVRFVGEVAAWPVRWGTPYDVTVSITAAGILRRLGQGAAPLQSPMFREFASPARTGITAYWPLEEGSTATEFASPLTGVPPMRITTAGIKPGAYNTYAASDALPTLSDGALTGTVPTYSVTGETALRLFASFPDQAPEAEVTLCTLTGTGTVARWYLMWKTDGWLALLGYTLAGVQVEAVTFGGDVRGRRISLGLELTQNGANIDRRPYFIDVDEYTYAGGGLVYAAPGTITGRTVGRITHIGLGGGTAGDVAIGHVALATAVTAYASTGRAMIGWAGETAGNRLVRLAAEETIPLAYTGKANAPTAQVGSQSVATFLDLVQDAAAADDGLLYEQRDALALAYRSRPTLYTQPAALTLNYAAGEVPPLDPVDDDQDVHNDVTIQREGGSSARAVRDTGPLSVNSIGRYAESTTLNLFADEQCEPNAWWKLHRGTWDAPRYPSVSVALHEVPQMVAAVAAVDIGARLVVANPPPWLPAEQIELLAEGYTETLGPRTWDISFMCSPGGPWLVATVDDPVYGVADTDGSQLAAPVTATATSLPVLTTDGPPWATAAAFPLALSVGPEQVTATGIAPAVVDAFNRTVNGGWGTADIGGAWTASGGTLSTDYAVAGGIAKHVMTTANAVRLCAITAPAPDADVYVDLSFPQLSTGAAQSGGLMTRYTDGSNLYTARLIANTNATFTLSLRKRLLGVETTLANYTAPFTHVAGAWYRLRMQSIGTATRARVWQVTDAEPDVWHIDVADPDLAGSKIGVRGFTTSGNTNTSPPVQYRAFRLSSPQLFTVTRGTTYAAAQPAGTAVALTHPPTAPL